MRKSLFCTVLLVALVSFLAPPASADTLCSAGSVCTVTLTQANVTQLSGIAVTVTIDNSGANTILSFQVTSSPVTNGPNGIDMVGWNAPVVQVGTKKQGKNTVPVLGPSPDWQSSSSTNFGGHQGAAVNGAGTMSVFGSFNVQGQAPANQGGFSAPIVFVLQGLVTQFYANGDGNEFAVHVRYQNGCSGFVGGQSGPTSPPGSNPDCTVATPEPTSIALLGTGLLGLVGAIRRRLIS